MCSVWKAPATCSGMTRALAGGSAARAASCSSVPAATTWPALLTLAAVSPCRAMASATSVSSPPTTALMPVGRDRARGGHRLAALADEDHGLLGAHDAGGRGRGDLAHRVAGAGADLAEALGRVLEEGQQADQPARDDQRLGDGGVPDGVGVGRRCRG